MTIPRRCVGKSRVLQVESRSLTRRVQLDRDDGFRAFRSLGACYPGKLDELIFDQAKKSTIVRVALRRTVGIALEFGFKEKYRVNFGTHEERPRSGEPSIDSSSPGLVKHGGRRREAVLHGKIIGTPRQVGRADGATGIHGMPSIQVLAFFASSASRLAKLSFGQYEAAL